MKKVSSLFVILIALLFTIASCESKTPEEQAQERLNERNRVEQERTEKLRKETDSLLKIINN